MKAIQIFPSQAKRTTQCQLETETVTGTVTVTAKGKRKREKNCPLKNGPKTNPIGTEFRLIVSTLSLFGNCPLSYDEGRGEYKFKWWSFRTWLTFLVTSTSFFAWAFFVSDILLDKPLFGLSLRAPVKEVEIRIMKDLTINLTVKMVLIRIIKLVFMALLIPLTWNSACGWIYCNSLAEFLNRWTNFESDFWKCFPFDSCSLTKSEKELVQPGGNLKLKFNGFEREKNFLFFKMKPSNFVAMAILSFCGILILIYGALVPFVFVHVLFFGSMSTRLLFVEAVQDVGTVFMYKNVMEAFARISTGIAYTARWQKNLTSDQVESWRILIQFVRAQCHLIGKNQQASQLSFLFWTIISVTCFAFVFFNTPTEDPILRAFSVSWNFMAGLYILRLFVKVAMAERVTQMESRIADELLKINMNNLDSATLVQIKFTHDLMVQNPSEISFGNYVSLNKGIFLKIFTQVVTYLIVMMQFIQNSN